MIQIAKNELKSSGSEGEDVKKEGSEKELEVTQVKNEGGQIDSEEEWLQKNCKKINHQRSPFEQSLTRYKIGNSIVPVISNGPGVG